MARATATATVPATAVVRNNRGIRAMSFRGSAPFAVFDVTCLGQVRLCAKAQSE